MAGEIGGERIGGRQQLRVGQAAIAVPHRERLRGVRGVPAHQRIDGVALPEALGFVFLDQLGRQPGQDGVHAGRNIRQPAS